ncbi:hypothetical protein EDC01DRAFT_609629 [Geopyxis carbonaria]|nr:hypothetical protein EDC01DRAFT_609629 [Geopyxis carbonaria]
MDSHPPCSPDNIKHEPSQHSLPQATPLSTTHSILDSVHSVSTPIPNPSAVEILQPRLVYLRDHVTHATIYPIFSASQVSPIIISTLQTEFNQEIARGDTYPLEEEMEFDSFVKYWFGTFAAIMLLGKPEDHGDLVAERDWAGICLGTFYIKANYPGRSSHICNAGFLTTFAARGRGCGKLLGEAYLDFAPKLGFIYSVFNLVFETNAASVKIWDGLGFKRIGLVKGAGRLRSFPNQYVDAIIYGRDLKYDEDYVSEERFDKIRFYLEKGKYPPTADRSEKSRLRSAATHYRLHNGKLMLKDKEVVSDSQLQYEIAKAVHAQSHGGINKTTANIAEKYHWVRIKETVSLVIRNCAECKEHGKVPVVRGDRTTPPKHNTPPKQLTPKIKEAIPDPPQPQIQQVDMQQLQQHQRHQQQIQQQHLHNQQQQIQQLESRHRGQPQAQQQLVMHNIPTSLALTQQPLILPHEQVDARRAAAVAVAAGIDIPVDPQMMEGVEEHDPHQHSLIQQFAPVATMHSVQHHLDPNDSPTNISHLQHQHAAAVAAARAALHEGGETLTEEDRTMKDRQDRHLMETLTAELKREGYTHAEDER